MNNDDYDLDELADREEWTRFRAEHPPGGFTRTSITNTNLFGDNESVVAVNPTDPNNVAYASLWELRVSTDGGVTFGPPQRCPYPVTHLPAGDPSIGFDAQGRLFWTYLGTPIGGGDAGLFLCQCDPATGAVFPGYPVNVGAKSGYSGGCTDKEWFVADSWPGSPYANRIYLAWLDLVACSAWDHVAYVSHSTDQGLTWSSPVAIGGGFLSYSLWPIHIAVAPNGDVYSAFHLSEDASNPITSGAVQMRRSTDGGATFAVTTRPFPPGTSRVDGNSSYQSVSGIRFWLQGCWQPWVVPDPVTPGKVAVFACNSSPRNSVSSLFVVRTTDYGATWTSPMQVDSSTTGAQLMATVGYDRTSGNIAAMWYDTRAHATNANGNYLLDTYACVSSDGGATFGAPMQINEAPFNPDIAARCRGYCPPIAYASWTSGPNDIFVTGDASYHWNGTAWSALTLPGSSASRCAWGSSATSVWLGGLSGQIQRFDGASWAVQASGTSQNLWALFGTDSTNAYAAGDAGAIVHWDGVSWTAQASGTSSNLRGLWISPAGTAWAVGSGGTVLRRQGGSWSAAPAVGSTEWLRGIWGTSDSDVWVAGYNGDVFHWNGAAWTTLSSGVDYLRGIWGSSSTDIYFVGLEGVYVHWDGSRFDVVPGLGGEFVYNVTGSGPQNIVVVGGSGGAWRFDGTSWARQVLPWGGGIAPMLTRIGEYIGVSLVGSTGVATWTGNSTAAGSSPPPEATIVGRFSAQTTGVDSLRALASLAVLEPGRPNPFRWVTRVGYSLPRRGRVALAVYDVRGRLVRTLDGGVAEAGRHEVVWDGHDVTGGTATAGVYFLRLHVDGRTSTRKLVLAR